LEKKVHYGWIVIVMGLLTTVAAHGFGRMAGVIHGTFWERLSWW